MGQVYIKLYHNQQPQTWTSFSAPHNQYHPFKINFYQQVPLSVCVIPSHLKLVCVGRIGPLLCSCDADRELLHDSCITYTLL